MSSDNANTPIKIKKIIDDFSFKKIDILVATQIMAKGYHFPNLSLVGIIDADAGLMGGDIRAIESYTSKLLTLVPKTFEWKNDETVPDYRRGVKDFGLIAEEVHEILPELVVYNGRNEPAALNYQMISVLLLEEVKKLKERVDTLEGN